MSRQDWIREKTKRAQKQIQTIITDLEQANGLLIDRVKVIEFEVASGGSVGDPPGSARNFSIQLFFKTEDS